MILWKLLFQKQAQITQATKNTPENAYHRLASCCASTSWRKMLLRATKP